MTTVRGFLSLVLAGLLLGQDLPPSDFFSGTVVALSPDQITVRRRALISNAATSAFFMDSETRVEGKLRVKANVTIRYRTDPEGYAKALRIIVR